MEGLGEPQTHRAVKDMISLVDDDKDGKISFREFLMIFRDRLKSSLNYLQIQDHLTIFLNRKQAEGELESDSGLDRLAKLAEIDVSSSVCRYSCSCLISFQGVSGAKNFFQAKVAAFEQESKITDEIRQELEVRKTHNNQSYISFRRKNKKLRMPGSDARSSKRSRNFSDEKNNKKIKHLSTNPYQLVGLLYFIHIFIQSFFV